jgi:hypothetical protein
MSSLFCKISHHEESQNISYSENVKLTYLKLVSRPFKNTNVHREYILNYNEKKFEIFT